MSSATKKPKINDGNRMGISLPKGWRQEIKREARKQRRTMNDEVVLLIQTAMRIKGINLIDGDE